MAPIRRKLGTINNGDQESAPANNHRIESGGPSEHLNSPPPNTTPATGSQQLVPAVDDSLPHLFQDLYFLIDIHTKDLRECADRLKIHLQHLEVEMKRRLHQVVADEGRCQAPATRVVLITCRNCKTLPATMVCYPCRHLCVCVECDTKISTCPICNNIKQLSFMANLSSA